jgi:catechol 2,3-dioxygenase-like lactoylglutathione lyase family enzyme
MSMALHELRKITVGVPDVAAASVFYTAFGLTPLGNGCFGTRHGGEQLALVPAPWRRLEQLDVLVDDNDDTARIRRALQDAGHAVRGDASSLRTTETHSAVNVTVTVAARRQVSGGQVSPVNRPGEIQRINTPAAVVMNDAPVQPSWLSHVVMGTPNWDATMNFFIELIGFEISDQIPGIIAFNRCSTDHHNLAIQAMPAPFLHHMAFEVDSADEVLRGGSNMIEADAERHMWGLGRHAIGSNWFWYLRDPAGNFVEYTADIDQISAQDLYVPKQWVGKEFLYAYGPSIPPQFIEPDDAKEIFAAQGAT